MSFCYSSVPLTVEYATISKLQNYAFVLILPFLLQLFYKLLQRFPPLNIESSRSTPRETIRTLIRQHNNGSSGYISVAEIASIFLSVLKILTPSTCQNRSSVTFFAVSIAMPECVPFTLDPRIAFLSETRSLFSVYADTVVLFRCITKV